MMKKMKMSVEVKGGLAGNPGVKRALAAAAPGASRWVYWSVGDLVKLILASMGSAKTELSLPEAKNGACFSFGAADGQVHAALDLPVGQLKVIGAAIKQLGGLMGGIQGGQRPPPPPSIRIK